MTTYVFCDQVTCRPVCAAVLRKENGRYIKIATDAAAAAGAIKAIGDRVGRRAAASKMSIIICFGLLLPSAALAWAPAPGLVLSSIFFSI